MTPAFALYLAICIAVGLFVVLRLERKVKKARNTRHVISLPIGARFTLDDSDSVWVLIHLEGCGQSVEWKGNFHPSGKQRHRQIVNKDADLRHVIAKVVS